MSTDNSNMTNTTNITLAKDVGRAQALALSALLVCALLAATVITVVVVVVGQNGVKTQRDCGNNAAIAGGLETLLVQVLSTVPKNQQNTQGYAVFSRAKTKMDQIRLHACD